MKKIVEYEMVCALYENDDPSKKEIYPFEERIEQLINIGFVPFGSPFVTIKHNWIYYNQAMVKYEDN